MGGNLWEKQLLYYLCLFLFGNKNNVNANALNENGELNLISSETIYYENGDYSIITTYANKSQMQTRSNVYQTTGEKTVKNYNKSNELLWTYTLTHVWIPIFAYKTPGSVMDVLVVEIRLPYPI